MVDLRAAPCGLLIVGLLACGDGDGIGPPDGGGLGDAAPGSGWRPLAPLPSGPRQETAVVAIGPRVYVIGGFAGGAVSDLVEVYDAAEDAWSTGPALPMPMHHLNASAVGTRLVLAGGMTELSFTAVGATYVWDTAGAAGWREGTPMPAGSERGASAVGAVDPWVYVAGGFRGGVVADASRYDVAADRWEPLADLPAPRDHLVGGVVDGAFYAVGGREGGTGAVRDDVWRWDGGGWTARAPMLTARGGCAGAVLAGRVYVLGGEGAPTPTGVFAEVESYDPAADAWQTHAPMATPRHGTGAAVVGDTIYVPGGATVEGFGAADTFDAFTP